MMDNCKTMPNPCTTSAVRDYKTFNLHLEPNVPDFPCTKINVSEFQLTEVIRVLSGVFSISITD